MCLSHVGNLQVIFNVLSHVIFCMFYVFNVWSITDRVLGFFRDLSF